MPNTAEDALKHLHLAHQALEGEGLGDEDDAPDGDGETEDAILGPDGVPLYAKRRIVTDPGQEAMRLDVFLTTRLAGVSRSRIKQACWYGLLKVNGKPTKVSYKVSPRDEIVIALPYPPSPDLEPEAMALDLAYEDDDVLVLNKPAGLVVHPGTGNHSGTLVNGLLHHFHQLPEPPQDEDGPRRPGLVHRLGKDTTGPLEGGKSEVAYHDLSKQFFDRATHRLYHALVWGELADDQGTIHAPIARSPHDRRKFVVPDDPEQGKPATTHYQVLHRFGMATLIRCKLETGRTHQIRVHLKHLGHTLFGDVTYGGNRILKGKSNQHYLRTMEDVLAMLPRQALHAKTLGFMHPAKRVPMLYNSPLPADLRAVLLRLASYTGQQPHPSWADTDATYTVAEGQAAVDEALAAEGIRWDGLNPKP